MVTGEQFQKQVSIVKRAEEVFMSSLRKPYWLIDQHGWGYDDIRVSMFGKQSGILNTVWVSLYFLQNHLTHREWWEKTYGENFKIFEHAVPQTIKCFDGQAKTGLIIGIVANVESAFRLLVRAIAPTACSSGTGAFASVYGYLLNTTGNDPDKAVYDLLRYMRNTQLHSDGVFWPSNGKDAEVTYRGRPHRFEVGKPFKDAGWLLCLDLAQDLQESMMRVVKSPAICTVPRILDLRAELRTTAN
jgi:hypothetical protein